MAEFVTITHPDLPHTKDGVGPVSKRSFELSFKAKGWKIWKPPAKKKTTSKEIE